MRDLAGERALSDPAPAAAPGESRARVLELLRPAADPLGVRDIAEQTGLRPNTARFRLDGLVEDGYAERDTEGRDQPDRPRDVYRAVPGDAAAGRRSYRLLAEILTTLVADNVPQPEQLVHEAGRAWGEYPTERPAPLDIGRSLPSEGSSAGGCAPPPGGCIRHDGAVLVFR